MVYNFPMFKFHEGKRVAVKNDNPQLGLVAGETGTIWALYDTQPPAYEVTFSPQDGNAFDALMYEEELAEATLESVTAADSQSYFLASA